ncbi:hypothetical protein BSIN_1800 [Burkholderia singularis]|uniref:Uncharacterized protein n=1 Tax=Burkholderia singularis TaxID=1503053 RepID=A0A238GZW6_9BURK|nr:hypothetical protein BSIN_1800 [Burkholderia singularis]
MIETRRGPHPDEPRTLTAKLRRTAYYDACRAYAMKNRRAIAI